MRNLTAVIFALQVAVAPVNATEVYLVDGTRSEAKFEVRYLYSTLIGRMRDISGIINLNPVTPTASSVQFTMRTGSLDTGFAMLDRQLRSAYLLNAARLSKVTFQSTSIRATAKTNVYQVTGQLTLHGVTNRVTLSVDASGAAAHRAEPARVGFKVRTTLNRKDYGIIWNKVLDHSALVGDDIDVMVHLVASKQEPMPLD